MPLQTILPPLIMFGITVGVVFLCLLPTRFKRKSALLNFYWVGFWMCLAGIATISGLGQSALLAGLPVEDLIQRLQTAMVAAFVFFVMFAWFRLVGVAVLLGLRRILALRSNAT